MTARGPQEEEVELHGERKRRRDGWRFDRFEASGEDRGDKAGWVGVGGCESSVWISRSERDEI